MQERLHKLMIDDAPRFRLMVEIVAACVEQKSFQAAATAMLSRLVNQLGCSGASYGIVADKHCSVRAVAHTAAHDDRMSLTRIAGQAMDEAISHGVTLVYPDSDNTAGSALHAHAQLAKAGNAAALCTLPISDGTELAAALTLEHTNSDAFDASTVAYCEALVALAGPMLQEKLRAERSLFAQLKDKMHTALTALTGPRHATLKLVGALCTVLTLVLLFVSGEHRVTADARLAGLVQRAVIAPMDGYILEARARAGDEVAAGDVLALLDDRDLKLERAQWLSEQQKIAKAYRSALGQQDRTEVVILKAKLDQATAKLQLAEEQLARSRIAAPLSGVIVAGDLSQSLGAPVERGDVLFEVTPLTDYRILLDVNERDIGELRVSQRGRLALNGFPSERFEFEVTRITPVSTARDGNNFFTVEAQLDKPVALLRPGMQGVAKVDTGKQKLGWIYTHELIDWLRLWLWV